mmetsp:Transcript_17148/g.39414  ORF Transcript_17148/g.39414 Transcript_17148/m.39414 type:complete len:99 (-) Transcript_17148:431-727(-)
MVLVVQQTVVEAGDAGIAGAEVESVVDDAEVEAVVADADVASEGIDNLQLGYVFEYDVAVVKAPYHAAEDPMDDGEDSTGLQVELDNVVAAELQAVAV